MSYYLPAGYRLSERVFPDPTPSSWVQAFDKAAERTRGKIRNDVAFFPRDKQVAGLLTYLADHLFDLDLDVDTWLRASSCPRYAQDRFVSRMGSLKAYLDERRIEVVAETIEKSSATLGKISRRAGFKVPRTFQRTFERVLGMAPSDLPRPSFGSEKAGGEKTGADPALVELQDPVFGLRLLATHWRRQVTLGLLNVERASELRQLLRKRYGLPRNFPWSCGPPPGWRLPVVLLLTCQSYEDPALAFEPTKKAIDHDAESAPELNLLFSEIYRHLFKPNLKLHQVLTVSRCKSSVWRPFTAAVGQSPWSYIHQARMEMAALMLLLTSLQVAKICRRIGYTSTSTFHQSFERFTGLGPTEYRRHAGRLLQRGGSPPWDWADADYWSKAVSGALMVIEVVKLDRYLEKLFPAEAWSLCAELPP